MKITNGTEIRNTEDLKKLQEALKLHYKHILDIFSKAAKELTDEEVQDYYVAVSYSLTLCVNGEEEEID